jgi:hypothetical protein
MFQVLSSWHVHVGFGSNDRKILSQVLVWFGSVLEVGGHETLSPSLDPRSVPNQLKRSPRIKSNPKPKQVEGRGTYLGMKR